MNASLTTRDGVYDSKGGGTKPRRQSGRAVFALVMYALLSISILSVSTNVSAATDSRIIASDQAFAVSFEVPSDRTVKFEVKVNSGPNINIFLMDKSNFLLFNQGKYFVSYEKGTFLGTSHASWDMSLKDGTYYLVMSRIGTGDSTSSLVRYSYSDSTGAFDLDPVTLALVVLVILATAMVVGLLISRRKETSTEAMSVSRVPPDMGTKYCRYCGSETSIDASYCEKCGKKLN